MKRAKSLRLIAAAIAVVIALAAFVACSGKPADNGKNDQSANSGLTEQPTAAPADNEQTAAPDKEPTQAPAAEPTEEPTAESLLQYRQVGDIITFGSYEQDNDTDNGPEPIEWIVLETNGNKALVISLYALDIQPYDAGYTSVSWETCTLRAWLNGTFINNAFSSDEQAMIMSTTVAADNNPSYSTSPGNDTTDKVFLLSIKDANLYFSSNSARLCQGTAYCWAQSLTAREEGICWWWLRSPGKDSSHAAHVFSDGSVYNYGIVANARSGVRPALWIDFESLLKN